MAEVIIEAEQRKEFGKNVSRRLRKEGKIPAVVYGHGSEAMPVTVDPKDVHSILHSETGHNTIFKLNVNGKSTDVLIKDYQLHPVLDELMHADFLTVTMDEAMAFEVPIEVIGTPKGVREEGGVLDLVLREVKVECLPRDVPDRLHVEVEGLQVGDSIRVERLKVDTSKITILSEPKWVILTVVPPHIEKEPEVVVEEEAVEPEVIKKGKGEEGEAEKRPESEGEAAASGEE